MSWMYEAKQNIDGIGPVECHIIPDRGQSTLLQNTGYHSPDGFQIGYEGSGPADLAYSILNHYIYKATTKALVYIDGYAELYHQQFKRDFVAKEKQLLQINSDVIGLWIEQQEK